MRLALSLFLTLGAAALRAAPPPPDETDQSREIVSLPAYFTEETIAGQPWRHGALPGFEVLSRCEDAETTAFIDRIYQLQSLLGELAPPELQFHSSAPVEIILITEEMEQKMSKEIVSAMDTMAQAANSDHSAGLASAESQLHLIPQIRLQDEDSMALDFVLPGGSNPTDDYASHRDTSFVAPRYAAVNQLADSEDFDSLALSRDYVRYFLSRRLPPPPDWFVEGLMDIYSDATVLPNGIHIARATWVSEEVTKRLRKNPALPRKVGSIQDLLTAPPPPPATDPLGQARVTEWRSQAALFVRWGLDGVGQPKREALWKFVERASEEPPTEALFQECFGQDFAQTDLELNAYLINAISQTFVLKPKKAAKVPRMELRNATGTELSRIQGDWESKEIRMVRARYPAYVKKYIDEARRTLLANYNPATADAGLLGVIGLYEREIGNDAAARDFLEQAVAARVVRPTAYIELARIRLDDAQARTGGPAKPLSPAQIAPALELLREARSQEPPLFNTYAVMVDAWYRCPEPPPDIAILAEGVHLFPNRPSLALGIATLEARDGLRAEASAMAARGLAAAPDEAMRSRFRAVQASLASGLKAESTKPESTK